MATACAKPPEGRARRTLTLLAGQMVRLTEHEGLSRETVRRRLAGNEPKPWRRDMWCIPQVDGTFVARMEDVLDLYAEGPDPQRPVAGIAPPVAPPPSASQSDRQEAMVHVGQVHALTGGVLHGRSQLGDNRAIIDVGGRDMQREQVARRRATEVAERVHGEVDLAAPRALVPVPRRPPPSSARPAG